MRFLQNCNLFPHVGRYSKLVLIYFIIVICLIGTSAACNTGGTTTGPALGQVLAFPDAEGFGAVAKGGRGGTIVRVTNLQDSGAGSLRAAVSGSAPRIVIFDVAGTIVLNDWLVIRNPYITIAGQTAPSPGITLRGAGLKIVTNDVVIQHLRIRVGDATSGPSPSSRDGFQILGPNSRNIILDHMSVSWAVDENGDTWYSPVRNLTISNSIISEGLSNSIHPKGPHSKGLLMGSGSHDIAIIGNLFAHNTERHPRIKAGTSVLLVNNVMYDARGAQAVVGDQTLTTANPVNLSAVGNVFLAGPSTLGTNTALAVLSGAWSTGSKIYYTGNIAPGGTLYRNGAPTDLRVSTPPIWTSPLTVRDVSTVESWVLKNAGSRPRDRDAVDERVTREVATRTGRIIDSPAQVGGWPTLIPSRRVLTLPADPNGDADGDGYTNIEELLHKLAYELTWQLEG